MTRESALIVGLGNPGKKYEKTRHNIGFRVVQAFAEKYGWNFKSERSLNGEVARGRVGETQVTTLFPTTYMNLSGQSVRKTLGYYKIDQEDLIVVSDDIALDFGVLRHREKGSAGGHNGLKDIEAHLGTQEYNRLRVGVGDRTVGLLEDYVLSPFTNEEEKRLPDVIDEGVRFLDHWLTSKEAL